MIWCKWILKCRKTLEKNLLTCFRHSLPSFISTACSVKKKWTMEKSCPNYLEISKQPKLMRFCWQKIHCAFIELIVVSTIVTQYMNTNDLARIWKTPHKYKVLSDSYSKRLLNCPLPSQVRILAFWQCLPEKNFCIFMDHLGFTKPYSKPPEVAWKKCKSWSLQLKKQE